MAQPGYLVKHRCLYYLFSGKEGKSVLVFPLDEKATSLQDWFMACMVYPLDREEDFAAFDHRFHQGKEYGQLGWFIKQRTVDEIMGLLSLLR
ncbi:hypothetical protein MJA45_03705 [Paenibacillus aurantius]|uniref:Uncharacterized protein n=1 Tax=Paenibacillus aurantius TaxID=2918900 RepID=A0AA96LIL8_9BACL|nr:hypothetical protein [Paenibacillus aurantius]WNQ12167.1 hypothetical protein MJA45_03705 [Paenibacillus aurantius]